MSGMPDFLHRSGILSIRSISVHPGSDLLLVCCFPTMLLCNKPTQCPAHTSLDWLRLPNSISPRFSDTAGEKSRRLRTSCLRDAASGFYVFSTHAFYVVSTRALCGFTGTFLAYCCECRKLSHIWERTMETPRNETRSDPGLCPCRVRHACSSAIVQTGASHLQWHDLRSGTCARLRRAACRER